MLRANAWINTGVRGAGCPDTSDDVATRLRGSRAYVWRHVRVA